jgi:hypothetical protein
MNTWMPGLLVKYLYKTLERSVFLCVPDLLFWMIKKQYLEYNDKLFHF